MSYEVIPAGPLEQGDIIRHVGVLHKAPIERDAPPVHYHTPVFVLSHGCEIDKTLNPDFHTDTILVAAVFRLSVLPKGIQGDVRKGRVWNAAYLPALDPLPEECYIDWRTVQPVDKASVLSARSSEAYLCTVTGEFCDAVAGQFWDFFFRPRARPEPRS